MQYKIGDRVRVTRDDNDVPKGALGTIDEDDSPFPWVILDVPLNGDPRYAVHIESLEPISDSYNAQEPLEIKSFIQGNKTMSVTSTIKRLALKATNPNEVAKRDAGLKDDCGNLTDAGKEALFGMLETQFDTQFTQLANDINAENKANA